MPVNDDRKGEVPTLSNTDLAFQRTQLAYERTLMAWVRTATSLISFGFSMYKFFQEMNEGHEGTQRRIFTPRRVGIIMILFALIGLLTAQIQHHAAVKELKKSYPNLRKSPTSVLAILVFLLGVVLLFAAFYRQ